MVVTIATKLQIIDILWFSLRVRLVLLFFGKVKAAYLKNVEHLIITRTRP